MKPEIILSQERLPASGKVQLNFLLKLHPESGKKQAKNPVDMRFVLDRSGSMSEMCADGNSKMEQLHKAMEEIVGLLVPGQDSIYVVAFDDTEEEVVPKQVVSNVQDLKREITSIQPRGGTRLSVALEMGVEAPKMDAANALTKVITFTDGEVNVGSVAAEERKCYEIAQRSSKLGIPFSVFATGVTYNEQFLRRLAEHAGGGSLFMHVGQVGQIPAQVQDEIDLLRSIEEQNIEMEFTAAKGVTLLDALKTVPQQVDLQVKNNASVSDFYPGLDVRGQSYLFKAELDQSAEGDFTVGRVKLSWVDTSGRRLEDELPVVVGRSDQPGTTTPVDPTVLKTVYNSAAVRATTMNDISLATTLFTRSGNDAMVTHLKTLGAAAGSGDEEAGRTLRTIVTTRAHLEADSTGDDDERGGGA
ncbi:MAG: vWA domain-containing protein [Promethearchaeota archaeon]